MASDFRFDPTLAAAMFGSTGAAVVGADAIEWPPIAWWEVGVAALGGALGVSTYLRIRQIRDLMTLLSAILLAAAWCALLAPAFARGLMIYKPGLREAVLDGFVITLVGALIGVGGGFIMEVMEIVWKEFKKRLPETIDEAFDRALKRNNGK